MSQPSLSEYKQRLAVAFDQRVNYDDEYTDGRAMQLVDLAQLRPGQRVLDIATGTGIAAMAAAGRVANGEVLGVDISTCMIKQAQQKVDAEGLRNIKLVEADIEAMEFNEESFDTILCSSAMMWMCDIPRTMRMCHRWLKPGGLLAFSCYSASSFTIPVVVKVCAEFGITVPNCNEPLGTHDRCRSLLQKAGFGEAKIQTDQLGGYLKRGDATWHWKGDSNWFAPEGNPLAGLSDEQLRALKSAYEKEIEANSQEQGFWNEITIFYVLAGK